MRPRSRHVLSLSGTFLAAILLFNLSGAPDLANSPSLPFDPGATNPGPTRATLPDQVYTIGGHPHSIAVGDFNADGYQDAAVANYGGYGPDGWENGDISVLFGFGDGTLAPQIRIMAGVHPRSAVAADFNGDGLDDLAVGDYRTGDVHVLLSAGSGAFAPAVLYPGGSGSSPQGGALAAGDFDGDGRIDLVVAMGAGDARLLMGAGDGTFSERPPFTGGSHIVLIVPSDLNGDGRADLVFGSAPTPPELGPAEITVTLGHGDGSFDLPIQILTGDDRLPFAVSDFDADGNLDLVVSGAGNSYVSLLRGAGDGSFHPPIPLEGIWNGGTVLVDDFNGDDRPDLAVTGWKLDIYLNEGVGQFVRTATLEESFLGALTTGDFDGNGKLDLVITHPYLANPEVLSILPGYGDGTFA